MTPASAIDTNQAHSSTGFSSPGLRNQHEGLLPRFYWLGLSSMGISEEVRISRRFNVLGVFVSRVSIARAGFGVRSIGLGMYLGKYSVDRKGGQPHVFKVHIMYKKKKDKVRLVDSSFSDGTKLGGTED
jgi:hypothetical protein